MTLVAIPLSAATPDDLLALSAKAATTGADVVEWRLDTCQKKGADLSAIIAAIPRSPLPVIATCRHPDETGDWVGSETARLALLAAADAAGAAYIDCELAQAEGLATAPKARLILSSHDFQGPGTDLPGKIQAMRAVGHRLGIPVIAKVAITARDAADLTIIRNLLVHRDGDVIALAMGEHGLPSRLLAGVWGGFLTFARLNGDGGSAPGQPTVGDLLGRYRLKSQTANTRILGVMGSPISHSLSPHIHNAGLAQDGVDAVYVPFRVENAVDFWNACGAWIHGLSITIPHKEALLPLATVQEAPAKAAGVCNTLWWDAGVLSATNTDVEGVAHCLGNIRGKTVLLLGAGGVARAVARIVSAGGGTLLVCNRTLDKAEALARDFQGRAITLEDAQRTPYDILVNGTSVGMKAPADTPWPFPHRPDSLVFDTVYVPLETRFLKEAAASGAKTVDGLQLFIAQAAGQYRRFTGRGTAPEDLMRQVARHHLQG